MSFVPGYLGTVTLDSESLNVSGHVYSLNIQRNVMGLPLFGQQFADALEGQATGTFSASGTVNTDDIAAIYALATAGPVAFSLQIGEAEGPTDGGLITGHCIVSNVRIDASADGKWEWSLDATTKNAVTHDPAGGSS